MTRLDKSGFSLLELLVVIAIMAILFAFAARSPTGVLSGSRLSLGLETVFGTLTSARQHAVTKGRDVEVRLIEVSDPEQPGSNAQMRAVQVFEIGEAGLVPVGKVRWLPQNVIVNGNATLTSLSAIPLTDATAANAPEIPGIGHNYKFRSFRFRPDGSANLRALMTGTDFFITIHDESNPLPATGIPANFATIQIEPSTGAAVVYRP
jgi:uncharacterized protein (TIGR02596 family)